MSMFAGLPEDHQPSGGANIIIGGTSGGGYNNVRAGVTNWIVCPGEHTADVWRKSGTTARIAVKRLPLRYRIQEAWRALRGTNKVPR